MPGKGYWSQQEKRKRCTGPRVCSACALNPEIAPHGPYNELRRRNPISGKQEQIYLGRWLLSDAQLAYVNENFNSARVPDRQEILSAVQASGISGKP